jgi:Skp family chaperone for outer membrane proteins
MTKKLTYVILSFLFVLCFAFSSASAQEGIGDYEAKLKDLEQTKKRVTKTYKEELRKINSENAKKISALKKGFHKTRKEYLLEKSDKVKRLRGAYDNQMGDLNEQETLLRETEGPVETSNFAKRRHDKD